nr:TRAP transporter small permease [Bacillus ectoiniformans]
MAALVLLIFSQVVGRYILGAAPSWTEELARYIHIWQVWVGASYAVKKGEHIRIQAFRNLFSHHGRRLLDSAALIIWFGLALFFAIFGTKLVYLSYINGQISPAIQVPMWMVFVAIPVGGAGMCIRLIQQYRYVWTAASTESIQLEKGA